MNIILIYFITYYMAWPYIIWLGFDQECKFFKFLWSIRMWRSRF